MDVHAGRWSIAWVVVAALVALGADAAADVVRRVQYLRHWFAPMRTAQMAIGEHRALHGDGPDETDIERLRRVVNTSSGASSLLSDRRRLQIDRGSFNLRVGDDPVAGNLTWRLVRADGDAALFWICGYAPAPGTTGVADAVNLTDVPPAWLPSVCQATP